MRLAWKLSYCFWAVILVAVLSLVSVANSAARTSSTGLTVSQHIYTDYVKLRIKFYAPESWGDCDEYGFCDYENADYTVRLYQTHNGHQRLVHSERDEMFLLSDGIGDETWEMWNFEFDRYEASCPSPPYYYKWVVTVINPYGAPYTNTSGRFYRHC